MFNLSKKYVIAAHIVYLPCDKCGNKVPTVSTYLDARAKQNGGGVHHQDCHLRMCESCLRKAIETFSPSTKP